MPEKTDARTGRGSAGREEDNFPSGGAPSQPTRLRLWELLRHGHRLTQAEAASRLDVTKRQVRRIVAALRKEGVPVRQERKEGERAYRLDGADLALEGPFGMLSERQALALLVAAEAARPTLRPTPLDGPLETAREALAERLAPEALTFDPEAQAAGRWHFDSAAASVFDPEVFEVLQRAVREQHSVRMDYTTASTGERHPRRRIDPLLLAAAGSSWLVVAYCHKREAVRDFALGGIEHVWPCKVAEEPGPVHFDPPEDFEPDLHFKGRFSAVASGEDHVVRLLAEPEAARYFRRKKYHPTQQIDEERSDGRVVVSFEASGLKEAGAFARSWGTGVRVLEPVALAKQVADEARAVVCRYQDETAFDQSSEDPL
jgi:predicted DNA-binding transcriptional regulator YafY